MIGAFAAIVVDKSCRRIWWQAKGFDAACRRVRVGVYRRGQFGGIRAGNREIQEN